MCGIFGIFSYLPNNNIVNYVLKHLKLLQHRGKDGYGVAYITEKLDLKVIKLILLIILMILQ